MAPAVIVAIGRGSLVGPPSSFLAREVDVVPRFRLSREGGDNVVVGIPLCRSPSFAVIARFWIRREVLSSRV